MLLEDLIGVQVASTPPHNNPNACAMNITHYPKVPKWASSNMTRKLTSVTLQFDSKPGFKDNLSLAMDWKKAIILQTQQVMKKIFYHTDSSSVQRKLTMTTLNSSYNQNIMSFVVTVNVPCLL